MVKRRPLRVFFCRFFMSFPDGLEKIIGEKPLFVTLAEYETQKGYLCLTQTTLVTISLDLMPIVINVCISTSE